MNKPFSLSKTERLKSKKTIDTLFRTGEAFFVFPYKVIFRIAPATLVEASDQGAPLVMGISVPKRIFKRANKRNRIKRLTRETYRINKVALKEALKATNQILEMMLIYTAQEEIEYATLELKMQKLLQKLQSKVEPRVNNEKI
jgi:ribonuclease P protein component